MGERGFLGWAHPRFNSLPAPVQVGSLEELERVILEIGGKARRQTLNGKKGLLVSCPYIHHGQGYGDRKPSLWVGFSPKRGWEFRCFANCETEMVIKAFQELGVFFSFSLEDRKEVERECDYQIFDEKGNLVAIHRRIDFVDGTKTFEWRSPSGKKGLETKVSSLLLYKTWDLPRECPEVWIVEGEKVAEALWEKGVYSVALYGSNAIPDDAVLKKLLSKLSSNARIILVPDCDPPGREAMHKLAQRLLDLGWMNLYWLDLGGDGGYDLADFFQENPSPEAFEELKSKIQPYLPPLPTASEFLNRSSTHQDFLVEELLPRGAIVFLVARPKVGKSMLASFLAKALVKGELFLGMLAEPARVLYVDYERPFLTSERLSDLGVGQEVFLLPGYLGNWPLTIKNLALLKVLIKRYKLSLVIIDTALPFLELKGEQDLNSYSKVYPLLLQLKGLASETGCVFLLIHHLRKSSASDTTPPELGVLGSTALSAVADTILGLIRKREVFELAVQGNSVEERKISFTIQGEALVLVENPELPETEQTVGLIWEYLKKKGRATRKEIVEWVGTYYPYKKKFSVSKLTDKALKRLCLEGKIRKQGATKNLIYEVGALSEISLENSVKRGKFSNSLIAPKQELTGLSFENSLENSFLEFSNSTERQNRVIRELENKFSNRSQIEFSNQTQENQGFGGFRELENLNLDTPFSKPIPHPGPSPEPVGSDETVGFSAPTEPEGSAELAVFNSKILEKFPLTSSPSSGSEPDPYAHLFHPQAKRWLLAVAKDPSLRGRQKCPGCGRVGAGGLIFGEEGELWLECPSCGSLFRPQM